ncbi:hypothetical protein, partial [Acinetobacter baumannii]|uniref:hypothetical protein n=1 Tax=Acinetobacter baumannii TaxID=470 RepID=UPI001C0A27A0
MQPLTITARLSGFYFSDYATLNNIMRYLAFMVVATYWLHGYIFNFLGYILATFTGIKKAAYE